MQILESFFLLANTNSWSETMPSGTVSSSNSICTSFQSFQNGLVGQTITSLTVSSGSTSYSCNDLTIATNITTALSTCMNSGCGNVVFICGSSPTIYWRVGGCGGGEITVSTTSYPSICYCTSSGTHITLRPCINNGNWGGLGDTCGASSQTLSITTSYGKTHMIWLNQS